MPLKSQTYNKPFNYPEYFTEEDKLLFDELYEESKIRHPEVYKNEDWILKYSIVCYMNGLKNQGDKFNDKEELEKLKEIYKVKSRVFETPENDEYKDPEKYLINLPDEELKNKLNISIIEDEYKQPEDNIP